MKIYQELDTQAIALVQAATTPFKTIEAYNEQYQNTTKDDAKGYPALYLELLEPINWVQSGNQLQMATVRTRLHVVHFTLKTEKTGIHELAQTAFEVFNQKALFIAPDKQLTTEWVRVASSLPKRYRQLKVLTIDFEFNLIDRSGMQLWNQANVGFVIQTEQ